MLYRNEYKVILDRGEISGTLYSDSSQFQKKLFIVCNPFGQEHLRYLKSIVQMCSDLAVQSGFVFNFDYLGTGNSDGRKRECRLDKWAEELGACYEALTDSNRFEEVNLIGLGLGANIIDSFSGELVRMKILWNPISNGRSYIKELSRIHGSILEFGLRVGPLFPKRRFSLAGFQLTELDLEYIKSIDNFKTSISSYTIDNADLEKWIGKSGESQSSLVDAKSIRKILDLCKNSTASPKDQPFSSQDWNPVWQAPL